MNVTTAIVSIAFINAEIGDDAKKRDNGVIDHAEASGTAVSWTTDDLRCAETLKEQLSSLLGEPTAETLLPALTHEAMSKLLWPGSVRVDKGSA
jgi:hypothetical protein